MITPPSPPSPAAQRDSRHLFATTFSIVARRWRQRLETDLARAGLTDATWMPLVHLEECGGGVSQIDLANRIGIDGSTLVRLLNILSDRGLVERTPDASDGRKRLINLTDAGRTQMNKILDRLRTVEAEMIADLPDDAVADMALHLTKIDARLKLMRSIEDKNDGRPAK